MISPDIIHGFAGSLLSRKYDKATPTPRFHLELWELFCSKNKFVAAAAPRGHGKSTAITFAYCLANVLFREKSFVIILSDTEGQSVNFLSDIKQELKDNDDLIELFQIKGFIKDTETDIIVEFADGHQFRIVAKGEGFKRGAKWNNKRPDLIICDDLENEEAVYNKDRREKFKRWFYGTVIPSLSPDGQIRVVGTILHMDSLLNSFMPDETLKSTTIEPLRIYNFVHRGEWKSVRYRAHNEDFSEILWAARFGKEHFIKLRAEYESKGLLDVYSQEQLNYPIDESSAYFKREDFTDIPKFILDQYHTGTKNLVYYAAVDFAISTKERSDFTVIVVAGVDDSGLINILDVRRGRWDALQIVDEMFAVQRKYDPHLFITERGAIEKALGPILRSEMVKRNLYLNLFPMTPTKDKQHRARSFQARLRSGGVRFDKTAHWYGDYEDELARFPRARNDDQVDASSWIGLVVDQVHFANTPEEDEEEYWNEMEKTSTDSGRSMVTGY